MKNNLNNEILKYDVQYTDLEHEAYLQNLKDKLITTVELQGKQDGVQNKANSPSEHKALILNLIEVTLQSGIDRNQQKYLPISGVAAAKLAEMEAVKKEQELQNVINDIEHALPVAIVERDQLKPDVKLIKQRKWVVKGLIFIAITEGYMSYGAFRHASFTILAAILACCAIAIAVGFGAHYSGGFIKTARNSVQVIFRYIISLVPAIVGFGWLAVIRSNAYNHNSNLQVGSHHVMPQAHGSTAAIGIAMISILLYLVAIFLSSEFFRTKAERLQEDAYEVKCNAVAALQKSIQEKSEQIISIRYEKIARMALAARLFEYAVYQECRLINFAQEAAEAYKQKNLRHRSDGCPEFFSQKPEFQFIRFFDNLNIRK